MVPFRRAASGEAALGGSPGDGPMFKAGRQLGPAAGCRAAVSRHEHLYNIAIEKRKSTVGMVDLGVLILEWRERVRT